MSDRIKVLVESILREVQNPQQSNCITNLKSWSTSNDIQIKQSEKREDGLIIYKISSTNPKLSGIQIFVYPDASIKISGKTIKSQQDFEKVINYLLS